MNNLDPEYQAVKAHRDNGRMLQQLAKDIAEGRAPLDDEAVKAFLYALSCVGKLIEESTEKEMNEILFRQIEEKENQQAQASLKWH